MTFASPDDVIRRFDEQNYLLDTGTASAIYLAVTLGRPLLLEGEPGVGKTTAAKTLAVVLDTTLIRLQCYEGLTANEALYDWNYQRQLLSIRLAEARGKGISDISEADLYTEAYLVDRPILRCVRHRGPTPPVLLIDEIDRADDEFEALLLEFLGESAVTVPELGTFLAECPPMAVLTSNRSRDLHDALRRRCLYHWIDYPEPDRAAAIVRRTVPGATAPLIETPLNSFALHGISIWTSHPVWPRLSTGWRLWWHSGSQTSPQRIRVPLWPALGPWPKRPTTVRRFAMRTKLLLSAATHERTHRMKIANEFTVSAPIEQAWSRLCDLDQMIPLMPGAQLIGHEGDEYLGKVKVKVGPVTSEFSGKVHFVEQDRNQHRAVFDAKGKEARGTGNAAATVAAQLHEVGERTRVTVDTDLKIVGKLAQFGSGMLQQVSEKLLGQFVDSLEAELAAQSSESPQGTPPATEAAPIDLLQLADGGQLKKYGSALLAALTVLLLIWVLRRRR